MSAPTRTSGSSYGGRSVDSAVSQVSHINPSFSQSTQTYSLPSDKAVCGARLDARNSNFDGVANLNVNLPNPQQNKGKWLASFPGQSDDVVSAKATLSCPAPAPSTGKWVASFQGQSDDGVSAKPTLSCPTPIPAPAPVPSPSTGIVGGYYDYYPIVWQPPANGWVKANSAGLISNGNPSVTTCGGLFRDSSGKFMGGFSQNLHMETSYFAEVMAAFLVIEHAYHKDWHNLWLETDSLLVVHLLTYRDMLYLPLNLRQKWIFDVQAKLPNMNFNFSCTFRENNRAAIFMAEIGRRHPGFTWCNIPSDHEDLVKILHHDSNGFPNHYIHV
ncbi:hypothetical protein LWI28_021342 [Acer negundo]|uniref:RNase H type-1 domain-containing protein n=1 Tax=Acer negundo TaxID=4023 RepID=A0AAD5J776_ACENE|nr:hypothetical protein LWI28_021342 [Acer negundo]